MARGDSGGRGQRGGAKPHEGEPTLGGIGVGDEEVARVRVSEEKGR